MTRTHDLLITNQLLYRLSYISIFTFGVADLILTKCIGVLRLAVFRAFGAFPLGILREVRPILSIVFVRSFPRVGHGVGQSAFRTQTKGAPPTAVTLTSALCPAHR